MNDKNRSAQRPKAQRFAAAEKVSFRDEQEKERAAREVKTAKLRALRLAKEADDKVRASEKAAQVAAAKDLRARKKAAPKKAAPAAG